MAKSKNETRIAQTGVASPAEATDKVSRTHRVAKSKKRSRERQEDDVSPPDAADKAEPPDTSAARKKRSRGPRFGPREQENDEYMDVEAGLNKLIAQMDGQLISDYLARKTAIFGDGLTAVELSDLVVPGEYTVISTRGD